jgi:hypothetical protein
MAIETRVHNLWNNLIESASHATGSLLIWDTGEYEVLPWKEEKKRSTDDELSDEETVRDGDKRSDSERLFAAFQARHIRLRLHGQKLPAGYTVSLRLPSANDRSRQPKQPKRKRRRLEPPTAKLTPRETTDSERSETDTVLGTQTATQVEGEDPIAMASEDEEDASIRANNAYTGAENTIGSVHQRNWFLTIDRKNSGFRKALNGPDQGRWVGEWEAFVVKGRDHEKSVVTGRQADGVMEDAGVEKFVGRKLWRPIVE